MEQMCSYCEQFFEVPADEHGRIDVCPACYEEYAPWMDGTEQEVSESWKIFEKRKLEQGVKASLLENLFETWRTEYKKRFGKDPQ